LPQHPNVSLWQQVGTSLQTAAGRLALAMSVLTLVLLALLVWPNGIGTPPPPPPPVAESLLPASNRPAGGVFPGSVLENETGCIWSGFQSVGKRWDAHSQRWISVGVGGTVVDLTPEVVVTLERVEYCNGEIVLTWSVRNNSDRSVVFPLQTANISIRDPIGNEYAIADDLSQPATLAIEPASQEQGIAIVPRPVSQNAPSLLVRLKHEPFGEASWLVSLED
jgi:hypothetical protein